MSDCDEKFTDEREMSDPRIRITLGEGNVSWKFQDLTYPQVRETVKRVALWVRMGSLEAERHDWEPGPQSLCMAVRLDPFAVQVAIKGLSLFDVAILCDNVAAHIDALLYAPHTLPELQAIYGRVE